MKKLKNVTYELPLTLKEFLSFVKNEKFVIYGEYVDYDTACYNADPDTAFFGSKIKSTKKGYFLSKPNFVDTFEFLMNYYIEKEQTEKAKRLVKIFNKYIKVQLIERPEIIYKKTDSSRDYYRNYFSFVYGEPTKENFDVYELKDCRPDFIINYMHELKSIINEYKLADELESQARQKRQDAINKSKQLKEKFDKVPDEETVQMLL